MPDVTSSVASAPVVQVLSALALAGLLVLATPGVADAHAMLIASEPAAGTSLGSSPARVRLVFSEAMDAALDRITLVAASGRRTALHIKVDPHDVHALVAPVDVLTPGTYWIVWRVVSADGHVVEGSFAFAVGTAPPDTTPEPVAAGSSGMGSADVAAIGPVAAGAPLVASAVRAMAVGCLMALAGLLVLSTWRMPEMPPAIDRGARWLAIGAVILSIGHLLLWLSDTAPNNNLDAEWAGTALLTNTGLAELARCVCALLTVWALFLVRRPGLTLAFAIGALVASALVGHAATSSPVWDIPAKLLHLLAAGMWLGGLLFLLLLDRENPRTYLRAVERVSNLALAAVVVVLVSGVIQTLLISPSITRLVHSAYGAVIAGKFAGVAILIAFGAYHRTRGIPQLRESATRSGLHRAVAWEFAVMLGVVALGGWLAYIPAPMSAPSALTAHPSTDGESSQ